jgi:hypothetical protein
MSKFIVLEEVVFNNSENIYNTIATTDDFVDAGELTRAKKIAYELQLSVQGKDNNPIHNFIVVERCDLTTLKE